MRAILRRKTSGEYLSTYDVVVDGKVVGWLNGTDFATPFRPRRWELYRLDEGFPAALVETYSFIDGVRRFAASALGLEASP